MGAKRTAITRRLFSLVLVALAALLLSMSCAGARDSADVCLSKAGSEIDRMVDHLRAEEGHGFSGAVLLADGDSILLERGFGDSAKAAGPSAFWIASISKPITATAVMQLVERGIVSLDAPIRRYFPEAPASLEGVTVHHLLAHRSGLPHAYAADGLVDREEAARALLGQKLEKKTGEFLYSNDGYNLLAILVERVSGMKFETFVEQNIFGPAEMSTAGFWGAEPLPTTVAPPWKPPKRMRATIWREGRSIANWGYRGATGMYATPRDLFRFARALAKDRLVSSATVRSMLTSKNPSFGPVGTSYGYGWALLYADGKVAEYWHGGNESWLGHTGVLRVVGQRTYVILSNCGDSGKRSWAERIEAGLRACEPTSH